MAAASSEKITVISSPPQAKSTAISIAPDFLAILVPDSKSRWVDSIRKLMESFRYLLASKGVDISDFYAFEEEMKGLPGKYSDLHGGELFAILKVPSRSTAGDDKTKIGDVCETRELVLPDEAIGCIAFRKHDEETAEMKRMFVSDKCRGMGLGYSIGKFIMDRAKLAGYERMVLDTLERLPGAVKTYEKLGFSRTSSYVYNPMKDAIYMEIDL